MSKENEPVESLVKFFGTAALAIGGLFFFIILVTFTGGAAGWVVGLVFADTILGIFGQLGIHNVTMFQIGCFMGFLGGFLKTKVSK